MGTERADAVVIGAGVIGLATARALALAGRDVLLLERHPNIGQEASSRNSEVIHAGVYYPPGSLKARTCLRGKGLLYEYCKHKGVDCRRIGKLIVATRGGQFQALEKIAGNARACGLDDLEWLDAHRLNLLEPAVHAKAAVFSPSTGIIDSHGLMLALLADFEDAGGILACGSRVHAVRQSGPHIELRVGDEPGLSLAANTVVNAAGLAAAGLARSISGVRPASVPTVHFVRGHYFTHSGPSPFAHLVYPMPEADGLGVHATLDLAGQLRFGPDAEYVDQVDYRFDDSRRPRFAEAIRTWYPALDTERLQPGYVGIRPRLAAPGAGFRDFRLSGPEDHGVAGLINLYGLESPGLTACLALADEILDRVREAR